MEYINEQLNIRFTVPDRPTVKQQLQFRGRIFGAGAFVDDVFLRYWYGFTALVDEWTSAEENGDGYKPNELIPDPLALDVEKETDMRIADIVQWVGNQTAVHMMRLDELPKNS